MADDKTTIEGRRRMSTTIEVKIHDIATDGLPDMEVLVGRVAFIFDGCIVSGWPLDPYELPEVYRREFWNPEEDGTLWEANEDVGHHRPFGNVTQWVEFPDRPGVMV